MRPWARRLVVAALVAVWVGVVVYPDPRPLLASVSRLRKPPVDSEAVRHIASTLPDDYAAVERYVAENVPWTSAWKLYGLPWYFPTVQEVLRDRAGDCQAQALLMASILQAKGMPYTFRYSLDHVWVDYPGKKPAGLEDPDTSFVSNEGHGWLARLPKKLPLGTIIKQRVAYHWTPMPLSRKLLILCGAGAIVGHAGRRFFARLGQALVWPVWRAG